MAIAMYSTGSIMLNGRWGFCQIGIVGLPLALPSHLAVRYLYLSRYALTFVAAHIRQVNIVLVGNDLATHLRTFRIWE